MNTDGLNLGLPLRGTADLGSTRAKAKDDARSERSDQGPDSFSDVLSRQNSPATTPRKENISITKQSDEKGPRRTEDSTEKPSVKEGMFERMEKTKGKKAPSDREKAMLEFMDSMESEFGIPPARMVEAMAQLPKEHMLQSPEETASQVIDALDLPPGQAEQAYTMYVGLLGQLSQMPTPVAAAPAVVPPVPALSTQERRALLNDSLDRLSQKFFLQGERGASAFERLQQLPPQQTGAEQMVDRMDFEKSAPGMDPALMKMQNPQQPKPGLGTQGQEAEDPTQTLMAKLAALGASAAALGESVQKTPNGSKVVQSGAEVSAATAPGTPPAGDFFMNNLMKGASLAGGQASDGWGSEDSDSDKSGSGDAKADLLSTQARVDHLNAGEKTLGFKEVMATNSLAPDAKVQQQPNLEKIMNQAQMIVRKGGGEATIRMSPEGLGDVQLKVVVKDGKVNLEMATETKEAKKMIESSLSDLKLGLGQHKLSVESVKIDVGMQSSADQQSNQQRMDQRQFDQGREQARQMFQQFRDDNLGRREPFFEMPGVKAYSRPNQGPKPMAPVEETAARVRATGRGERMNLVA